MPTITIDIPTEQVDRVRNALGVSTTAEAKQWVIEQLKSAVKAKEARAILDVEDAKVAQAEADRDTAINGVAADVESTIGIS